MSNETLVRTIDNLRACEQASLLQRFAEAEAYTTSRDTEEAAALEQMIEQERSNIRRLVELLDWLDATPGPRRVRASTGDLHYNKLHALVPRLIEDKKQLIACYESASTVAAADPRAADLVATILGTHREHLKRLEKLVSQPAS